MSGWFAVAWSDEIPAGGVEPLLVDGREYALYRDEEGAPHALDAHCRHLGAHLAYGGRVEGCALRCPFHGWRWEPDGVCSDVPYSKRIPPAARIRAWPVMDRNGLVLVWTGDGQPDHEIPAWEFESGAELRHRGRARGALGALAARCDPHASSGFGSGSVLLGPRAAIHLTPIAGDEVDVRLSVHARSEREAEALLDALRDALEKDPSA